MGTVHVIVTNSHASWVRWQYTEVRVPIGDSGTDLASDGAGIVTGIDYDPFRFGEAPTFTWDAAQGLARASFTEEVLFAPGMSMTLALEHIPVSTREGLALLELTEFARGGDRNAKSGDRNGVLNANAHMTVRRDKGEWVLKTGDEKVVINADHFHVMGMMSCRSREWEQH
ncbi:hypothetical protein [Streptomyces sulfonofaciens]|uniref:hypothetical protein n=1 Tax=Streptomyces sulfonofaciens TaxID=68272 RepID=UPI0016775B9A|nr:hypothetical protein [Streptomyces sulfonofaciens]